MPQRAGKRALAAGLRESPLSHEQIARRAYEIWQAKGRPQGSDLANWLEAIEALKLESKR